MHEGAFQLVDVVNITQNEIYIGKGSFIPGKTKDVLAGHAKSSF
jgi:hypothetical protein